MAATKSQGRAFTLFIGGITAATAGVATLATGTGKAALFLGLAALLFSFIAFIRIKPEEGKVPKAVESLVMKALGTQKESRYQTAEELRDAVQVKLSQLNPTISADALAHYLRGLFKDEITEEHKLVQSMKAVDMAPFQNELTQATEQHTVTFARAQSLGARIGARLGATPSGQLRMPTEEQLRSHPRRRFFFFVGVAGRLALAQR